VISACDAIVVEATEMVEGVRNGRACEPGIRDEFVASQGSIWAGLDKGLQNDFDRFPADRPGFRRTCHVRNLIK
jgi:hypothetical protein